MQTETYKDLLAKLNGALAFCQTLNLKKGSVQGRFGEYRSRIEHLIACVDAEGTGLGTEEQHQDLRDHEAEYVMALTESMQFVDVVRYLRACGADLRKAKVRDILGGCPSPHDETPPANHARNTLFEIVVASKFWRAGITPRLGPAADVEVTFEGTTYLIECKRPLSLDGVKGLIVNARGQLLRARLGKAAGPTAGLIALSCLKLREGLALVAAGDEHEARAHVECELRAVAAQISPLWGPMDEQIVAGALLHLVKAMKFQGYYATVQTLLVCAREGSTASPHLRRMSDLLRKANRR